MHRFADSACFVAEGLSAIYVARRQFPGYTVAYREADPGNGLAGDFIVNNLSAATVTAGMAPLDGSAGAMLAASKFATSLPGGPIDGVSSVDALWVMGC